MSKREKKTIEYYMSLSYTIEIIPDEGAWFAQLKELDGCMTEVDEWDEILPAIEDAKRLWLELALERGREIPEPIGLNKYLKERSARGSREKFEAALNQVADVEPTEGDEL